MGTVPGRRKCGVKNSSVTSAMHVGLLPQGSTAMPPALAEAPAPRGPAALAPFCPSAWSPLRPRQAQPGMPGRGSSWGPGHGWGATGRGTGHRAWTRPSTRDSSMAVGSRTGPSYSPGVPCPTAMAQQEQEGAGARLCAGQDVPWHSPRPCRGPGPSPPQPHNGVPCPCWRPTGAQPLQPVCAARSPPWGWCWRPPRAGAGAVWTWCSSGSWGGTGNPVLTIQPLRDFLRFLPSLLVPALGADAGTQVCHSWAAPSPAAPPGCLAPRPDAGRIWPCRSPGLFLALAVVHRPCGA